MRKIIISLAISFCFSEIAYALRVDSIVYGAFGKIVIYHPEKKPTSVALFVSGDGGWEQGVDNMAKNIADHGALVIGIDVRNYKRSLAKQISGCLYPAADLEDLSLTMQKKYKFPAYFKPVLIGYSYGATLIYGILAQAPANTFKGALALGFSPDLKLTRPLCKGTALRVHTIKVNKSYSLEKTTGLTAPFIVLNSLKDLNCRYAFTRDFLKNIPMAELVILPKVGHGFGVTVNWMPQFYVAYKRILDAPSFAQIKADRNKLLKTSERAPLSGNFPLALIPSAAKNDLPLVFFISGDGGWTSFDQAFSEAIAGRGMPVIGMDAQKYFWNEKTPQKSAADFSRVINYYMKQWNKRTFVLMGFSFGASIVPFIVNRLAEDDKNNMRAAISFSPEENADFEIHIVDMLNMQVNKGSFDVLSEMTKIRQFRQVCVFGKEEDNEMKNKLSRQGISVMQVRGGHHYDNDYKELSAIIFDFVK